MVDITKVKDYLSELGGKYRDGFQHYLDLKELSRVEYGIKAVDEIRKISSDISHRVAEGHVALRGAASIVRSDYSRGENASLGKLSKLWYTNKKPLSRVVGKVLRRKPGLRDALEIVGRVAENIPSYVERLTQQLSERRKELSYLRGELREKVEEMIASRQPLQEDYLILGERLHSLEEEYKNLESERLNNSSQGLASNPKLIEELGQLELIIGEAKDKYRELKAHESVLSKGIENINNQVGKVGQLLDLLGESQQVAHLANEFVKIQVPYIVAEIHTQASQIQTLVGVDRVGDFLRKQAEVSGVINDKIKVAVAYLGKKVEALRDDLSERDSIYASSYMIEDKSQKSGKARIMIDSPKHEDVKVKGYISFSEQKKE